MSESAEVPTPAVLVPDPPATPVTCVVCGWPVQPGAPCDVDGTVAPAEVKS